MDKAISESGIKEDDVNILLDCILLNYDLTKSLSFLKSNSKTDPEVIRALNEDNIYVLCKIIASDILAESLHEVSPNMVIQRQEISQARKSSWDEKNRIINEVKKRNALEEDFKLFILEQKAKEAA